MQRQGDCGLPGHCENGKTQTVCSQQSPPAQARSEGAQQSSDSAADSPQQESDGAQHAGTLPSSPTRSQRMHSARGRTIATRSTNGRMRRVQDMRGILGGSVGDRRGRTFARLEQWTYRTDRPALRPIRSLLSTVGVHAPLVLGHAVMDSPERSWVAQDAPELRR